MNGVNITGNGVHPDVDLLEDATSSDTPMEPNATERGLDRRELVRIIVQAIDALGYTSSARALEKETGVEAMSQQMRTLRHCVLEGKWDQLERVLAQVTVFKSDNDARAARFVLYEQKFLELLEAGHTADALECLRNDLTRLSPDPKLLHKLPLLCMCTTADEVRDRAEWPGAGPESRTAVLEKLQRYIPASELLQENRLENLLWQAIEQQKRDTMFPYTRQSRVSLLEDMVHCEERVPRKILHRLEGHTDEVWFVQFSHRGEYLASSSKDALILVWRCGALLEGRCNKSNVILHKLRGHTQMVCFLSWSPDDQFLLSTSNDQTIRLWDMKTGECCRVFEKHTDPVTSCAWMPNGKTFVSGSQDQKLLEWNVESGEVIASYTVPNRVNDLTISTNGKLLVATCSDNTILVFDTGKKQQLCLMKELYSITSLFLSADNESLIVSINSQEDPEASDPEIHVWNISKQRIVQRLTGYKQTRYVIRACFGGHNQMLVLSGSEDELVYIWERRSGKLIAKLRGHDGTVNTITCNENNQNLFASGSDDKTIIIWGPANGSK
ncbi:unnamed protein product [Agarophyton chilense]|eukprot:gb/GEZJ01000627.1/.p1 GENE.gb/GEZJ01000627.1/~~gb/GEZJ01000627.1/.p1  ORF type:complete len:555 (-),score=66.65 gb/GEZJ01000627.1/:3739-5403(-)